MKVFVFTAIGFDGLNLLELFYTRKKAEEREAEERLTDKHEAFYIEEKEVQ